MTDTGSHNPAQSVNASSPSPTSGWARVTNQVIVRVTGPGTNQFLQGQFSQHLDEVVTGHSPRAAASNPKGRAYCLTRLVRDGDDVLMTLDSGLADTILKQLRKYLMLFRGTSADLLESGRVYGILGTDGTSLAADGLEQPGDTRAVENGYLVRVEPTADGTQRFELWQTQDGNNTLKPEHEIPLADWLASEIEAGVPSLTDTTLESYVPQMLNWHRLGGVHFKKGCYTGQEIIARMHFLGQLKKSLYRLSIDNSETAPKPGTRILSGERAVGDVVNAIRYTDGHVELLAVIRHDAASGDLSIEDSGAILNPRPLPYSVPEREDQASPDT
ncbi:MAG: folate-binding protein [Gammaproteobacteria bacterium]|nr:MAG: folate-binding protein [Gammaproteobacteria bacterium]